MARGESRRELERRGWVERQERFRDLGELYERDRAAATTDEERQRLMASYAAARQKHRAEDIALGKRLPGFSIATHQIMWARWLEVAVEHELEARTELLALLRQAHGDPLLREFRASLVAIIASALTVEAVYGDIKYLIPAQPRDDRDRVLRRAFSDAFGIPDQDIQRLASDLAWLFALRDEAAHPYTETAPTARHPAGLNTGAEHQRFNAIASGRAVDTAMRLLGFARTPPVPLNNWIIRWASDRAPYHVNVVDSLQHRRATKPLPRL